MKTLLFRVDMNQIIATGHLMRCLSVAAAASSCGIEVVFITADSQGKDLIESKGYTCIVLGTKWDRMESELDVLLPVLDKYQDFALIIDSYYVTERYMAQVSGHAYVAYIDDLNSFIYPVNMVICYANYADKFNYKQRYADAGIPVDFLLGCKYVPLRSEFRSLPAKSISRDVRNLLMMSGGSDPYHICKQMLEKLNVSLFDKIEVICGRYNEDYGELIQLYEKSNVRIHKAVDNLIDYMRDADVAISAGGSTLYELCACGTPTITYAYADNQIDNVNRFDRDGLMAYAGDVRNDDVFENVIDLLQLYTYENRAGRSMQEQRLVDGNGAARIVDELRCMK